jgi:PPOX class probable F420-dependent enzyme
MAKPIEVPDTHADLLKAPLTAVFTTLNPDGQPQSTAVWYLLDDDGVLKVSVVSDRQKYKNLVRNPRATLFLLDPAEGSYRTLEVRAMVELSFDTDKSMLKKFAAQYDTPIEILDAPGAERAIVALNPSRVVVFG